MIKYVLERLMYGLITLFLVVSITFLLLQFMPGSPFNDDKLTEEQLVILNDKYGLDDPIPMQYARYMKNVFTGDFGVSFQYNNQEVSEMIAARLPVTVRVGGQALIFGALVGIFLGAIAALKKNTPIDHATILIAILGVSVPSYVMASLMQYYLGVRAGLLPVVYNETAASTIMPTLALSLFVISSCARFMRTELVEVLSTDYILLARAKGMSRAHVIYKHALRNALIPVITVLGPMTISLLTGSTVIEKIFGIPGVSFLLVEGIQKNDYFVILGVATFYSALYITVLIIIDILYGIIDPRIRLSGGAK
ncbi:ABC transporter permease [Vallitalea okinawensis]|uniref:ABC transporter permease n=1 Tax=Vallitalea okinawensis TaxID=2078660 RepID=UPI000CFDE06C|nr:ABC transporter permease [Vallitalea okinawensis]